MAECGFVQVSRPDGPADPRHGLIFAAEFDGAGLVTRTVGPLPHGDLEIDPIDLLGMADPVLIRSSSTLRRLSEAEVAALVSASRQRR